MDLLDKEDACKYATESHSTYFVDFLYIVAVKELAKSLRLFGKVRNEYSLEDTFVIVRNFGVSTVVGTENAINNSRNIVHIVVHHNNVLSIDAFVGGIHRLELAMTSNTSHRSRHHSDGQNDQ